MRANRVGGGLPSAAGGVSWLTRTLNCTSRSARLRGAAGSAETSRLAVASVVPDQASGGIPPTIRAQLDQWESQARSGDEATSEGSGGS